MERVSYVIFIPDGKKFHLTRNWIVFSIWTATLMFFYFFETEGVPSGPLGTCWVIGVTALSIFYLLASFFTYLPLNGVLNGEIEFEDHQFVINDEVFKLSGMKAIDFSINDFYGKSTGGYRGNFNQRMSRGVDNHMQFVDNAGQIWIVDFQIQSEHGYLELAPFINEAIRAGKMPIERGIDLMGADNISC